MSLLDRGFVYAIAHIRGGQEMGRAWYEDGKLLQKKNTFTDFIDVTEAWSAQATAPPDQVFAMGGSAGGLLMGAVATSRRTFTADRLAGAVRRRGHDHARRTIPLTTNEFDEWGNPKKKEYYDYMLSYSPYDQPPQAAYPAMLVTTGLWDSQVQYWEPAKYVAELRTLDPHRSSCASTWRPDMVALGPFARLEQVALEYAFILMHWGMSSCGGARCDPSSSWMIARTRSQTTRPIPPY